MVVLIAVDASSFRISHWKRWYMPVVRRGMKVWNNLTVPLIKLETSGDRGLMSMDLVLVVEYDFIVFRMTMTSLVVEFNFFRYCSLLSSIYFI